MNDRERQMWIDNDEPLYTWWKSTRMGMRKFMRKHREEIDAYIAKLLARKPSHG